MADFGQFKITIKCKYCGYEREHGIVCCEEYKKEYLEYIKIKNERY